MPTVPAINVTPLGAVVTFPEVMAAINDLRHIGETDEVLVINMLTMFPRPIHQWEFARALAPRGSRVADGLDDPSNTDTREARRIIRRLRVERGIPILSDTCGYWLPATRADVDIYVDRLEKQARATAAAWFTTYKSVRKFTTKSSAFLELFVTQKAGTP